MSFAVKVEDIHLVREEDTGKSRGFAFLKYEDSRSCVLAVDNFVGVKVCGRSLRVDHVEKYRLPKKLLEEVEAKEQQASLGKAGHAYQNIELSNKYSIEKGKDLFAPPSSPSSAEEDDYGNKKHIKRRKHEKKHKKRRRKDDEDRRRSRDNDDNKKDRRSRRHRHRSRREERDKNDGDDEEEDDERRDKKRQRRHHLRHHDDHNDKRKSHHRHERSRKGVSHQRSDNDIDNGRE